MRQSRRSQSAKRTRSREPDCHFSHARFVFARGLDAPGWSWTRSHLLLVKTRFSVLHRRALSSEVQGCSRKTKDGHPIAHETNTCVVSTNFQRDCHFQRARIRFTVLTRHRAFDAKRERLNNT